MKIPAEQILQNVGPYLPKDQLVYVATDEKNKTFFNAFQQHFKSVLFLNDFIGAEQLKRLNPNMLGMIDQVVCTRGEKFVGTWFSTFTGYITRLRGYLGYSDQTVYFGDKVHRWVVFADVSIAKIDIIMSGYPFTAVLKHQCTYRDRYHRPELPMFPFYMREWNISWDRIDE